MKKQINLLIILLFSTTLFSQNTPGEIKGKVFFKDDLSPVPGASVYVEVGNTKIGDATDYDGKFTIKPLDPGTYTVTISFMGMQTKKITSVKVQPNKIKFLDAQFLVEHTNDTLPSYTVETNGIDLIDPENPTANIIDAKELKHSPALRDPATLLQIAAPGIAVGGNGEVYIRGSRSDAVQYFVDGVKTKNLQGVPGSAIQSLTVYTGGVPAMYGDVTGGVVILQTKSFFDLYRERKAAIALGEY